ncbi:hypothetical protein SVA_1167 [Sulfurifustis variabilis]|uniref:DUF1772 domain-containing protein n=1 Tax=Sulfurifustis variabilis TaxID=1675686 RepID=A0A1B4V5B9_9GAMM|nr:DUF1772 domain-containing protein [Sulfurifustis variabilis]BAU47742.1 hypothetical protein SVA_1167 [Sulfurifustis variabilis]
MPLKIARFITLVLLALVLGVSFSHALQAAPKATLAGFFFLDIHHVLLSRYGTVMGTIEVAALVLALVSLALVRRERPPFVANLVSVVALAVMLLVWAVFIYPINQEVATWTAVALPADWEQYRDRWHLWHAIRTGLALVAFGAFAISLLVEPKKRLFASPY